MMHGQKNIKFSVAIWTLLSSRCTVSPLFVHHVTFDCVQLLRVCLKLNQYPRVFLS